MSECWKEFVAKFPFVYLVSFSFSNLAAFATTCHLKLVLVLTIVLLFGQFFNFRIWQLLRSFLRIFHYLKVVLVLTIILLLFGQYYNF